MDRFFTDYRANGPEPGVYREAVYLVDREYQGQVAPNMDCAMCAPPDQRRRPQPRIIKLDDIWPRERTLTVHNWPALRNRLLRYAQNR